MLAAPSKTHEAQTKSLESTKAIKLKRHLKNKKLSISRSPLDWGTYAIEGHSIKKRNVRQRVFINEIFQWLMRGINLIQEIECCSRQFSFPWSSQKLIKITVIIWSGNDNGWSSRKEAIRRGKKWRRSTVSYFVYWDKTSWSGKWMQQIIPHILKAKKLDLKNQKS